MNLNTAASLISAIAQVAHEVNRAYCASIGDKSQVDWADAPEWQRKSAMAGVKMHLDNPDATPEQSHESWLSMKLADGWVYGDVKDEAAKTHPCCVPYEELPEAQKSKDYLFRAVVHSLKSILPVQGAQAEPDNSAASSGPAVEKVAAPVQVKEGYSLVQYVGRKPDWRDTLYRSNLAFSVGQIRSVPNELARKLLKHTDAFKVPEQETQPQAPAQPQAQDAQDEPESDDTHELLKDGELSIEQEREAIQAVMDVKQQVQMMDKPALKQFAMSKFQQPLDLRQSREALVGQINNWIDRFGVV